jgi:hypothetical protein
MATAAPQWHPEADLGCQRAGLKAGSEDDMIRTDNAGICFNANDPSVLEQNVLDSRAEEHISFVPGRIIKHCPDETAALNRPLFGVVCSGRNAEHRPLEVPDLLRPQ